MLLQEGEKRIFGWTRPLAPRGLAQRLPPFRTGGLASAERALLPTFEQRKAEGGSQGSCTTPDTALRDAAQERGTFLRNRGSSGDSKLKGKARETQGEELG